MCKRMLVHQARYKLTRSHVTCFFFTEKASKPKIVKSTALCCFEQEAKEDAARQQKLAEDAEEAKKADERKDDHGKHGTCGEGCSHDHDHKHDHDAEGHDHKHSSEVRMRGFTSAASDTALPYNWASCPASAILYQVYN